MTIETDTRKNDRGPAVVLLTDQAAEEIRMGITYSLAEVEVLQILADPILLTAMET